MNDTRHLETMINGYLDSTLSVISQAKLRDACRDALFPGGKRLRAVITVFSCEAVGGRSRDAIPLAAAVELIHNASLVYDDILSRNPIRRNRSTINARYGSDMAVMVGETLHSLAFDVANSAEAECCQLLEISRVLSRLSILICQGATSTIMNSMEIKELKEDGDKDSLISAFKYHFNEARYLDLIRTRTGILVGAATKIGAIIGGGKNSEVEALCRYGEFIGTGYQIVDDLLDMLADESTLGKPIGRDLKAGIPNLAVLHAVQHADTDTIEHLIQVLGNPKARDDEVFAAIDELNRCGSIDYTKKKANEYIIKAFSELDIIADSDQKRFLKSFDLPKALALGGGDRLI